ncbi:unnamed protein product [Caenorhabditis bovis]|uniref:Uncharacterized protein n=1 Tax=Caenorhabditis bovis TaxID=2654633 RepID=A0A8S1EHF7_9PELO|nr:unnamed protein product [Caenorhabditis bovis]
MASFSYLLLFLAALCSMLQARYLFNDMDEQQQLWKAVKRNRLCMLNAGLSQGCDFSDMITAQNQKNKFMSFASPGRK